MFVGLNIRRKFDENEKSEKKKKMIIDVKITKRSKANIA